MTKEKKPQGILDYSTVLESEVDLTEFKKKWREGMEKANKKRARGGVALPPYRRPPRYKAA